MNKLKFSFFILPLTCLFLLSSCTNLFHDLLPSDKKEIIDFQIQYVNGTCSEKYSPNDDNNIEIVVPNDTDVKNLIPVVSISEGAEIVPLTVSYITKIFPEKDTLTLAIDMYLARQNGTFESWFINLILDNGGIEIPKLDMPIDFSTPVIFVVISGSGNYEFYTVTVKKELPTQDDDDDNTSDEPEIKEETDNFILSFKVPNQIGESKIYNSIAEIEDEELNVDINSIGDKVPYSGLVSFEVGADFDLKEVIPTVTVSEGAKILPLTEEYILSLGISFADMINFYSGYSTTTNVERYISDFLKKQNNIVYPEINIPLNFDNTNVSFAVVSESGSIKIYNVKCKQIELNPKLTKIIFSKLNNEFLCKDSIGTITDNTIKATCMHPMEMEFDYGLIPEFVYEGDRVTFTMKDGIETELISGVTKIPFTETNRICVISVYIGSGETEKKIEYELYCPIEYDPDSIRSIIDFRFYKSKNTQIKNTVLASIHNEGDTGFITATVMYEGEVAPYELVADFVSPGTVTKNGSEIITGVTSENFEYSTQYLCTSKNGLYCRLYDISIKFMQIVTIEPVINSFEFPSYLNKDLSKDCIAQIDELTKTIRCEVLYHSSKPPYDLIPSFVSSGTVTCDGMLQTSGFSGQNFRYTNYYTVTTGDIELSTSRYRVEVVFLKDDSSSCDILDFGFKIENNASLSSDVQATVTERTQKIFAFMPYGAGSQSGTLLTPTFTSNGTVSVNGQNQTSGISSQDFSSPITYTVTSLNGLYTKEYIVSLQESGSIIYVDKNAVGRNNGTSWDDAFINLDTALEYVNSIDDSVLQEVWITADEYEPILNSKNGFNIRSNLILRGGFKGTESASNDRLVDSENCLENHTVLKRQPLNSDEESLFYANEKFTGTFTIDGFDIDLEQTANETFLDIIKVLNPKEATQNHSLEINNCLFNIKTQNSSCRFYYSEKDPIIIQTSTQVTNNVTIENTKITGTNTFGFSMLYHQGDVTIKNVKTNCLINARSNNYVIEDCIVNNEMFDICDTNYADSKDFHFFWEDYLEMVNVIDRSATVHIKNSYFNNINVSGYGATIENSTFENSCIYSFYEDLNLINSNLDLIAINNLYGALSAENLIMKDSTLTAETVDTSYIIQVEDSEITVGKWIWDYESGSVLYDGNSFIKNSTIKSDGGNLCFSYNSNQYQLTNGIKPKDFYIENSIFIGGGYIGFGCENLTIKNSDFYMLEEDDSYCIVFSTKNLVLEGNDFDTTLIRTTENFIVGHPFALIGTDDNVDFNNAEIKNNTFGNLCEFAINNGQDIDIEENYFGTGCFLFLGDNVSIKNNTFEDLEYIRAGNILEYENNKVINKNSNRGYKYISATEFPYTEFNYENFCYFYSSGELVFNNCIFEPCTQTYSLPQGNFTFGENYILGFVSGYININNSTVNLGLSNFANLTIDKCVLQDMKSISNSSTSGVLSINDSTVTNGKQIVNEGTLTINNSNINLTSTDGTHILKSTGNLSINGGTFNLKSTQGGYSLYAGGSLSINGGIFNFEHANGSYSMYVFCDATISDAKFNFTGDEYTSSYCAYFTSGTNGSTIKNCEFIIDKCARGGIYANQAGLKIENSKFDINVYPQNSGDTCYGFYGYKDFSIDGGTYDLGNLYKSSSANMIIKNATVTANCAKELRLTENSVIENSTMNLELSYPIRVVNYSNNISNTKFVFSGEQGYCAFLNNSEKLTNCCFDFSDLLFGENKYYSEGVLLESSCIITNCLFEGFVNPSNITCERGAAVRIDANNKDTSFTFENCIFRNNRVTGKYNEGGAALHAVNEGICNMSILLKNCSFINNRNDSTLHTNESSHIIMMPYTDDGKALLILEGTNIMENPSCPEFRSGYVESFKNNAVYIKNVTVTGTIN